ncbi:Nif3-like dinuclear metal center hexameric protein [Alicyclobacillus sp. ALC3]|uniref:Nif3-like dinuclear metal center hexameric protein n=1 Tax=Alicyclobacillus sp. ALC3 TaxID=2796143 RepID=UPI0023795E02|nr:Nif3-like dinuclear metal center hexameric protein [Alicyclobacillus sp. ALC3]WDL96352.1 Nif3-like dinuclear metal center hexameric protein [Alicyclobacillus sp. ALC3]
MITAREVIAVVEAFAPTSLAFPDDPIGLQAGRMDKPVAKVWLALDPSPAVIAEAVQAGADLLITHHELFYRPLKRLDTQSWRGRAIATAIQNDLTIYAAHTNLDVTEGGVNDVLAELFELRNVEIVDRLSNERLRKLVVFVPLAHAERVRSAICDAGAGFIGRYSHCTFNTPGQGTFLAQEGADPFLGEVGELTRADEVRIETVVPEQLTERVIRAMVDAHPYEEVAYDLYPLELMGRPFGIGRVGDLDSPRSLGGFADFVRQQLGLSHIRFGGDAETVITRVAVVGGSGGRWADKARAQGAQVLVTADCDHHQVAEAWEDGLAIVDATHAALERPVLHRLREVIEEGTKRQVDVHVSALREDPFTWA